jgi:hypothetical protein
VEVAVTEDRVLLRDSREPDGPRLSVSRTDWLEFLAWARRDFTD